MSEQCKALAEALWRHRYVPCSEMTPTVNVWWAQCEGCDWKGPRRSHRYADEGDHRGHVADTLARLLADAEQRALREAGQDFLAQFAGRGVQAVTVRRWLFDRAAPVTSEEIQ